MVALWAVPTSEKHPEKLDPNGDNGLDYLGFHGFEVESLHERWVLGCLDILSFVRVPGSGCYRVIGPVSCGPALNKSESSEQFVAHPATCECSIVDLRVQHEPCLILYLGGWCKVSIDILNTTKRATVCPT